MNDFPPGVVETLADDGEFVIARVGGAEGEASRLLVSAALAQPTPATLAKLERAWGLRDELDSAWAARPIELVKFRGQPALELEDPGGESLAGLVEPRPPRPDLLRLTVGMARALGALHARGLVHKDVRPANFIVKLATGEAWLTGFGLASRLPRHRQQPEPPEIIAGTLAYMAPEQTGRMNRSIDARSDLYALGVTFYELFVGERPFTASDPMEWIHCHLAKRPADPARRPGGFPAALAAIILKLLAKAPEERYQTAAGLEADLQRCLAIGAAEEAGAAFSLGSCDRSDRLLIPEKLYGREKEVGLLLAAFDRVVSRGTAELVLVAGYSGVGKSSVVHELHRALVPPRGLFAGGKFDQYKRDIPYATLAQALGTLIKPILSKTEAEVGVWRELFHEALGANGALLGALVPEIELIIGEWPPVPDLPPQEARSRFQITLRRFIAVFARPEHPLVLFLDDLQWLDQATLELLVCLLADPEVRPLLLVGAYRDNEVQPGHPLRRALEEIREAGGAIQSIELAPLHPDDLGALVAESLRCHPQHSAPLAQLLHEKTSGNPFFAIQFFTMLAEEKLVAFDAAAGGWRWDLARIVEKACTDNVVELMVAKLHRLPEATQRALQRLACVGHSARAATLQVVYGASADELHAASWEAIRLGLISRTDEVYAFTHDRIHEAAYALVPESARAEVHLRIGRALAAQFAPAQLDEQIFEVVNQLNRGAALLSSTAERAELAELNLRAGLRAKASSAFAAAATYFRTGRQLLATEGWVERPELAFALSRQQAESAYMAGDLTAAQELLEMLSQRTGTLMEHAAVTRLRVDLLTNLDHASLAVETGLAFLRRVGLDWPLHPTDRDVDQEYERLWQQLGTRSIEELIDLPPLDDAECEATLDVLMVVHAPANFTDGNLLALTIGRMVSLCVEHGHGDTSPFAYVYVGMILGSRFGNYRDGFRFGQLGVALLERSGLARFKARVLCNFGNSVNSWARHIRTSCAVLESAWTSAHAVGDFTFLAYSYTNWITALLGAGNPLGEIQEKAATGLALVHQAKFSTAVDMILGQIGLIRALRGQTTQLATFDHAGFDEAAFQQHLAADPGLAMPHCWYWIRKLQALVFAGNYHEARAAAAKARSLLWTSPAFFVTAEYHFYGALAWAADNGQVTEEQRTARTEALFAHRAQLRKWVEGCPENFTDRAALIEAEVARIEGRPLDAMELYEQAVQAARTHGFGHHEGLADEYAARFHAGRGFATIAETYLRNARYCYLRWGADGKVRQLDQAHPQLRQQPRPFVGTETIRAEAGHLDLATIVKTSQAVSGEIVLSRLIEQLMKIAVEYAGAERGVLVLAGDAGLRIEAEAMTAGERVEVTIQTRSVTPAELPESILHYVSRTRVSVVLNDASVRNLYSDDEYLRSAQPRSVLCLPIVKQALLIGLLYLENKLAPHTFTAERVAVLDLLSSQAAFSLENARLYAALERENQERKRAEEELRRSEAYLAEAQKLSCTGSFGWSVATDEHFWSDETYRIFGYEAGAAVTLQMVRERVHPEDHHLLDEAVTRAAKAQGFDYECRLRTPDGGEKQVKIVAHAIGGELGTHEFVGAVMDISATRQAEAALRQAQAELAHVTRVTTMGELAASIAHEVNQPISGVVLNGNACLRWLSKVNDDAKAFSEVQQTIHRIIRDGNRAGQVIARIRALFKKTPATKEPLDLNETIREVVVLVRSEMDKQRVALRLELASALPSVRGDRVQLQQVTLNLILNAIEAMASMEKGCRELLIQTSLTNEGEVMVAVRDSGQGLRAESREQIFTAFYTTKSGGLGMGLSIGRSIVENHGGRLWATEHAGPGASFHFTLPINPAPGGPVMAS